MNWHQLGHLCQAGVVADGDGRAGHGLGVGGAISLIGLERCAWLAANCAARASTEPKLRGVTHSGQPDR